MKRISIQQLFSLIVLFEIGSTTIFALGIYAKQDAWLAILLALATGFILLGIYTKLQSYFPKKNLAEIIIALLGKPLGTPLVILYALKFIFISIMNFTEFGELITMSFYQQMPRLIIFIFVMLNIFYIIISDIEVIGRVGELLMPVVVTFIVSTYVLVYLSGELELTKLTPVLAQGIKPVFKAAFPHVVNFPFGEMVIFLMYWKYVDEKNKIVPISYLAMTLAGLLLSLSLVVLVSSLGAEIASNSVLPLMRVIRLIDIGTISHIDIFGAIIIFIGGFFKMTLFFYGGILALATLFNIKEQWLILPAGLFVVLYSHLNLQNFRFHHWLGEAVITKYIYIPLENIIPLCLLIICWLKNKVQRTE